MNISSSLLLPKANANPVKTFLVKGDKGSGKSTLINALLARNFIQSAEGGFTESALFVNLIHDHNGVPVKKETRDVDLNIHDVDNVLPIVGSVQYTFVDCSEELTANWYGFVSNIVGLSDSVS
jgi:septin family protein